MIPEEPLRYREYENALVVPTPSRGVYRGIDGAAFTADGRPIQASLLTRTWVAPVAQPPEIGSLRHDEVPVVEAPHVFGGPFFHHFGHFLLESLARTWIIRERGPLPFVWIAGGPPDPWQAEILEMVGAQGSNCFPAGPTRFRRLIIPDVGFRIQGQFHPQHATFLGRHRSRRGLGGRTWLSRTGIKADRRSHGESKLQAALEDAGWRVVYPEQLSVAEQLEVMCSSSVVAGLEGSAFHGAVLLLDPPAPFLLLRRSTSSNYEAIASARGICEIDLYGAFLLADRRCFDLARPARWAGIVDEVGRALDLADAPAREELRREYQASHDRETWLRRQRWRLAAHAGLTLRNRLAPALSRSTAKLLRR